jgi:hypothetical protein
MKARWALRANIPFIHHRGIMLGDKAWYLKYDMLSVFELLNQYINYNLQLSGPPRAGSGTNADIFSDPPARVDQLKIFTLNQKD